MTAWDKAFATRSRWHLALAPIADALASCETFPRCEDLSRLAETHARVRPAPRFVEQEKPKRRRRELVQVASRYDGHVALTGSVPTRADNWHDLYNALVFILFSRAKRALHARQFAAASAAIPHDAIRVPGRRTREQDHLTILDEGSVLVACAPGTRETTIASLLANGERALEDRALRAIVFGHAVYEHFHLGRPPVRAMTIVLELPRPPSDYAPAELIEALDVALAESLCTEGEFMDPSRAFSTLLSAS